MKRVQNILRALKTLMPAVTLKTIVILLCGIVVNVLLVLCSVFSPVILMGIMDPLTDVSEFLVFLAGILVAKGILEYSECIMEKMMQIECTNVNNRLEELLAEKFTHVNYAYLQNADFLNLHAGAHFALENYKTAENLMKAAVSIVCQSVVLLSGGGYLLFKYPVVVAFLAVGFCGQFFVNVILNKKLEIFFGRLFPVNRRYRWLNSLKFDASRQKDIRAYHMEMQIENKLDQYNNESLALFKKMNRISCRYGCAADIFGSLTMYAGFGYNAISLFQGKMDLGLFMSLNTLLLRCSFILSNIGDSITTVGQMLNYMKPIVKTLDYVSYAGGQVKVSNIESIEFRNVSFSYPDRDNDVLNNISFRITRGEKIGMVGLNGSGKSTIVKLMCGLYQPTKGQILINDIDIAQLDLETLYMKMGIVFQDFNILDFSIKENIILSDTDDDAKLEKVIEEMKLGDFVDRLHDHVNTKLGPKTNEKGISLSGGQLQKIAVARALYTEKDVYIFDEPDSNIDPVAEKSLYQQYNQLIQDKLAVFVSHRLKALAFCNRIILIENGCISYKS